MNVEETMHDIGIDYLKESIKFKKEGDKEKAVGRASLTYGIFVYYENIDLRVLSERVLEACGLQGEELQEVKDYGYDIIVRTNNKLNTFVEGIK